MFVFSEVAVVNGRALGDITKEPTTFVTVSSRAAMIPSLLDERLNDYLILIVFLNLCSTETFWESDDADNAQPKWIQLRLVSQTPITMIAFHADSARDRGFEIKSFKMFYANTDPQGADVKKTEFKEFFSSQPLPDNYGVCVCVPQDIVSDDAGIMVQRPCASACDSLSH